MKPSRFDLTGFPRAELCESPRAAGGKSSCSTDSNSNRFSPHFRRSLADTKDIELKSLCFDSPRIIRASHEFSLPELPLPRKSLGSSSSFVKLKNGRSVNSDLLYDCIHR